MLVPSRVTGPAIATASRGEATKSTPLREGLGAGIIRCHVGPMNRRNAGSCRNACREWPSIGLSIATRLCVETHIVFAALALRLRRRITGNLDEVYSREKCHVKAS
jgi:hypothetical protein